MWRILLTVAVVVMALIPMAVQAETVFIPQAHNGQRDWFTVGDVLAWIDEAQNVMPVYCYGPAVDTFTSCTVVQAQPLTLVWSNELGKVVAQ